MRLHQTIVGGLFLLLSVLLIGCGKGDDTVEVSGTVNYEGKPLEKGSIQFSPVDGKTATSGGDIIDGKYSFKSYLGNMKVSISAPKVVGKKKVYETPDSPVMDVTDELLPKKFNEATELQYEVKPGPNQKDWDLQSK
jgi:major membrane immunogen (membrane-anchored lipoprotein)